MRTFSSTTRGNVLANLNTLGWVLIILGVIQLTAGFSLMAGQTYGRVIGIIAGSLGAIGALLSIGGNYPWWSLAIFALCVYVVCGLIVFGEDEKAAGVDLRGCAPGAQPLAGARIRPVGAMRNLLCPSNAQGDSAIASRPE